MKAELDLGDLAPDTAPDWDTIKNALAMADEASVAGPVPALAAVLTALHRRDRLDVPVAWVPSTDPLAAGLARKWGLDANGRLGRDSPSHLGLVCDDQGGVLLARGRIAPMPQQAGARRRTPARFGAQIYHDDQRVADGEIQRVDVRPDWSGEDQLKVTVHKQPWRRGAITLGRAVQVACDEAQIDIDGVPFPRPMTKWTWYADPRRRWTLRST